MPQNFILLVMRGLPLIVLTVLLAAQAQAAPLTTKYYSLDLPADWVVVNGPTKVQEAVQVVMGQKEHKSSALIIVGLPTLARPSRPPGAMPNACRARRLFFAAMASGNLPLSKRA